MPSAIVMRSTFNGSDGSQLTQYFHTHFFSLELCKVKKYYCPHFTRSDICTAQVPCKVMQVLLSRSLCQQGHTSVSSGANGKYRGSQLLERSTSTQGYSFSTPSLELQVCFTSSTALNKPSENWGCWVRCRGDGWCHGDPESPHRKEKTDFGWPQRLEEGPKNAQQANMARFHLEKKSLLWRSQLITFGSHEFTTAEVPRSRLGDILLARCSRNSNICWAWTKWFL